MDKVESTVECPGCRAPVTVSGSGASSASCPHCRERVDVRWNADKRRHEVSR